MSNEDYWLAHELGEMCRRKCLLFLYPNPNPPHKNIVGWLNIIAMDRLDEKQKQGRLIVGGKRK